MNATQTTPTDEIKDTFGDYQVCYSDDDDDDDYPWFVMDVRSADVVDTFTTEAEATAYAKEAVENAARDEADEAVSDAEGEVDEAQAEVDRIMEELAEARKELAAKKKILARAKKAREALGE